MGQLDDFGEASEIENPYFRGGDTRIPGAPDPTPTISPTPPTANPIPLPPPFAAVGGICPEGTSCIYPMVNFQRAGCIAPNVHAVCDPYRSTDLDYHPAYIDGFDHDLPACTFDLPGKRLDCQMGALLLADGLPGIAWGLGASVVFNRGLINPLDPANLKKLPYGGYLNTRAEVDSRAWNLAVSRILSFRSNGLLTDGRYCYGDDRERWGTPERPRIIVVTGQPGNRIRLEPGIRSRNEGTGCSVSSGEESTPEEHYILGFGILLVDNVNFEVEHNFVFHGLLLVNGPQGRAFLDVNGGSSLGPPYTVESTAVYGSVVLKNTSPDLLGENPTWDGQNWNGDSDYHGFVTAHQADNPRVRFSRKAYGFAEKAYEEAQLTR